VAHTLSARKRIRQDAGQRARNRAATSRLRTQIKAFRTAASAGNLPAAQAQLLKCESMLDRAAQKKIIHKGNAARHKSRLVAVLAKLSKAQSAPAQPQPPQPTA
jgi:small subunit ribosomal protein S20